jgi:hypothetical protein
MSDLKQLTEAFNSLRFNNITGADREGIEALAAEVVPELERLTSAYRTASEEHDTLATVKRERTADLATVQQKRNEHFMAVVQETTHNPAADTSSLGMSRLALEQEVELLQDTLDHVDYVLCPTARDKQLETRRDLLRTEHLEAALYAALSHATMLEKLERAGLSQSHGRVVAFSETTERLKLVATECHRRAQLADAELTAERATQLQRTQQRHSAGLTTRAEATFSAVELSRSTTTDCTKQHAG